MLDIKMRCTKFEYSNHAVAQMFKRGISADEVESVLQNGETIKEYPEDKPFPSCLMFHLTEAGRPIHVVVSQSVEDGVCYIITTYEPDSTLWQPNFKDKI
jgi:hypothetical protein